MKPGMCRNSQRPAAFALMSVFVLVTALSFVVLEFTRSSSINLRMAINASEAKKAQYYAFGGYKTALTILKLDTNAYDGPGDFWYGELPPIPFEDGVIAVTIEDELSRFNIQELITENGIEDKRRRVMLERMFDVLFLDKAVIDAIVDWQDSDEVPQGTGAESYFYSARKPSYKVRNSPMMTTGELLLVKDIDREMLFLPPSARTSQVPEGYGSLNDYLTVYGDGRININTARFPVLLSLSQDMDESTVVDILDYRQDNVFERADDLKNVESVSAILYDEIAPLITVKSDVFRITATGTSGRFMRTITAVVLRNGGGFRVVYFNRSL
jgi:general secretion pathway protein K